LTAVADGSYSAAGQGPGRTAVATTTSMPVAERIAEEQFQHKAMS
jgi:hypothetical protein